MVALFAGAQRVWAQRVGAQLVQFGTVWGGCAGWAVVWFVAVAANFLSGGHQNFLVRPPRSVVATAKELVPGDL